MESLQADEAHPGRPPQLMDLIQVIIEEKTSLFVCAVGVPPKEAVEALHKAGIVVMNMVRPSGASRSL